MAAAIETLIFEVLTTRFGIANPQSYSAQADFMLDFGLDSMQLVQLLVDLEVKFGIAVPEAALEKADFSTVATLAKKIAANQLQATSLPAQEQLNAPLVASTVPDAPELDIKVHCFVSCLCEPIKKLPDLDHRPFYFGVWDANVFIDEQFCLSYHTPNVDHSFFAHWYQRLYGVQVQPWYDHQRSKAANLQHLQLLLGERKAQQWLMVMLDMYLLPERENKFNKNPFPHYVMLENMADAEQIWMWDPDFRWQGALNKERVFHAVIQPSVAGGYWFDTSVASMPNNAAINEYFIACFKSDHNPMTHAVRTIIQAYVAGKNGVTLAGLGCALRELPVLAIRKYAYEHGLAFFWRDLALPADDFEEWCLVIEKLVKAYDHLQFLAMKYASQPLPEILQQIEKLLREQDEREFKIKNALHRVHKRWQEKHGLTNHAPELAL